MKSYKYKPHSTEYYAGQWITFKEQDTLSSLYKLAMYAWLNPEEFDMKKDPEGVTYIQDKIELTKKHFRSCLEQQTDMGKCEPRPLLNQFHFLLQQELVRNTSIKLCQSSVISEDSMFEIRDFWANTNGKDYIPF